MDIQCASFRAYDGALRALRHAQASGLSHSEQAVEPSWTPPFVLATHQRRFRVRLINPRVGPSGPELASWRRPIM
jgi:hypothetical protein